jgi:hypothetical protein
MNKEQNQDAVLSIVEKDGNKWVRVQALGEDFLIATEDINDRNDMSYDEAMSELKKCGLDTFDRKQGLIITIYIEKINKLMEKAGGEKFKRDWYVSSELWHPVGSCADYSGRSSWFFNGSNGCFGSYGLSYGVFCCRPILTLPKPY